MPTRALSSHFGMDWPEANAESRTYTGHPNGWKDEILGRMPMPENRSRGEGAPYFFKEGEAACTSLATFKA